MIDANKLLGQVLGSGAAGGIAGGAAAGALTGMLTGKKGKKLGKTALKVGGLALVGGLAWQAWSRYRGQQAAPAATADGVPLPPAEEGRQFLPPEEDQSGREALGALLIRAMIAAAQADGRIDAEESRRIFEAVEQAGLSGEERQFLMQELGRPVDMGALALQARMVEQAAEVYAASLMVIDGDTPEEQAHLDALAGQLGLDPALRAELHRSVEGAAGEPAPSPA